MNGKIVVSNIPCSATQILSLNTKVIIWWFSGHIIYFCNFTYILGAGTCIFVRNFILDFRQGSEYASGSVDDSVV